MILFFSKYQNKIFAHAGKEWLGLCDKLCSSNTSCNTLVIQIYQFECGPAQDVNILFTILSLASVLWMRLSGIQCIISYWHWYSWYLLVTENTLSIKYWEYYFIFYNTALDLFKVKWCLLKIYHLYIKIMNRIHKQ